MDNYKDINELLDKLKDNDDKYNELLIKILLKIDLGADSELVRECD